MVVIDEYADLVMVLDKKDRLEFEREISRLAQRARSVGIHLVLATQRPTADVVTTNLKTNLPCRISFKLPSLTDSRVILDQSGAENLFGKGDMLLLQHDYLNRLQAYFVSPGEISEILESHYIPGASRTPQGVDAEDAPDDDIEVDDSDLANREALVGEVTGLASHGDELSSGETITIETEAISSPKLEVTGAAGDVLKQSVQAAWRYVQQHYSDYGIDQKTIQKQGISVHLVNISEFRDGPSAGIAFLTAIVSAYTGRPVRAGLAMSGEVSLKGKVTEVGGIPQKIVAAFRRGRRHVIIPKANEKDLMFVPSQVKDSMEIHLVENAAEAVEIALDKKKKRKK